MAQLDAVLMDALNRQVTQERYNVGIYAALANRLEFLNLPGLAAWMRKASAEEQTHADKFSAYLIDRNAYPLIAPLEGYAAPDGQMINIGRLCFAEALRREQTVTEQIKIIYDIAEQAGDPQTCVFLHEFLTEQTSAERELIEIVARLQFAEGCPAAVLLIDKELGA